MEQLSKADVNPDVIEATLAQHERKIEHDKTVQTLHDIIMSIHGDPETTHVLYEGDNENIPDYTWGIIKQEHFATYLIEAYSVEWDEPRLVQVGKSKAPVLN